MAKKKKLTKEQRRQMEMDELYGESCDDRFAFIAGYTSGGAPYGTTWEEMGIDPSLPFSEKVSLLGSGEFDLLVKNIPEENEEEIEESLQLQVIPETFSICQVENYKGIDIDQPFVFTGRTDEEKSLVCPVSVVPESTLDRSDGWRMFRICGQLDFSLIGILAELSSVFAKAEIGIFAISTYNTDYVLVKDKDYRKALKALARAGYRVLDS